MGLCVELINDTPITKRTTGVFVRNNGSTEELTNAELVKQFPDQDIIEYEIETYVVFEKRITHNLNTMAQEVGIYKFLWRPNENGCVYASDIIDALEDGLKKLIENPDFYKQFNPVNNWGNYDNLVSFVSEYINACKEYPNSKIEADR